MLSNYNPPLDPSSPLLDHHKISAHLKASDDQLKPITSAATTEQVDHLPKFSIRDFVFAARNKDIKTNWPFTEKDLQLCLKHGLKELLPPFQSVELARKHSFGTCQLDSSFPDKDNINNSDGNPSVSSGQLGSCSLIDDSRYRDTGVGSLVATSSKSEVENDFVSTTASKTQPHSDQPLSGNHTSDDSTVATGTSLEASVEVDAIGAGTLTAPNAVKSKTQNLSKKCRSVVKFNSFLDRNSKEGNTAENMVASEAVSSKVCPVCKTFSSSSNTTLNAHIDHCLSMESTSNAILDCRKTNKYKIKPKRMRSMVDICATAPRCTLEDLDRRNGSNWAADLHLPSQLTENGVQGIKPRPSLAVHPEEISDEGSVYIDSSGTKVRILSKLNGLSSSSSNAKEDPERKKVTTQKSRFCPTSKGRHHDLKHQKVLKPRLPSNVLNSSPKPVVSKVRGSQCSLNEEANIDEIDEDHALQFPIAEDLSRSTVSQTLSRPVHSRRSHLEEKTIVGDGNKTSGCGSPAEILHNDKSCIGIPFTEKSRLQKFANLHEKAKFSSEICHSIEKRSHGRKDERTDNAHRSLKISKKQPLQLSEKCSSPRDRFTCKRTKYVTVPAAEPRNKRDYDPSSPFDAILYSPSSSKMPSWGRRALSTKAVKPASFKKRTSSVGLLPVRESRVNKKKFTRIRRMGQDEAVKPSGMDDQVVSETEETDSHSETEDIVDHVSGRSSVDELGQEGEFQVLSNHLNQDDGNNLSVRTGVGFSELDHLEFAREEVEFQMHGLVSKPCSKIVAERISGNSGRSRDLEFDEDASPETQTDSLHSFKEYEVPLYDAESAVDLTKRNLGGEYSAFCAGEVGNLMQVELNAKAAQWNSFPEIHRIPIPGPPGSFLPGSPGDAESEDFQGNSSLTSGQVHSSQDQHDTLDGNSSDSPNSAVSAISNTMAALSNKCAEHLSSFGSQSVHKALRSGFSGASPRVMENETILLQTDKRVNGNNFAGEVLNNGIISAQKVLPKLNQDDQPCCFPRRENVPNDAAFNDLESSLFKRRIASLEMPSVGKQLSMSQITGSNNLCSGLDRFSMSFCSSSGSENVVHPAMEPPPSSVPIMSSSDAGMKFPSGGDPDSVSPASNPVLRLMGKNLVVVKSDENSSPRLRDAQPGAVTDSQYNHMQNSSWPSPGIPCKKDYNSFQDSTHQGSVDFSQRSSNSVGQHMNFGLSSGFRSQDSVKSFITIEEHLVALPGNLLHSVGEAPDMYGYPGDILLSHLSRSRSKLDGAASASNTAGHLRSPDQRRRSILAPVNSFKEIIIIDDNPESEVDRASIDASYPKGFRDDRVLLPGISIAVPPDYNPRTANAYPYHQIQCQSPPSVLATMQNTVFHAPCMRHANPPPAVWNCTSGGSSMLQQAPFVAPSSKTSQSRSAYFYSPGMP